MWSKKQISNLILASLLLLGVSDLQAQRLDKWVTGTAGGMLQNGTIRTWAVAGESAAGYHARSGMQVLQGFMPLLPGVEVVVNTLIGQDQVENINVYPNPFLNELVMELPRGNTYRISLYDLSGQLFYRREITGSEQPSVMTGIGELSAGIYLLEIMTGTSYYAIRVLRIDT